jgi:hypothetical protein
MLLWIVVGLLIGAGFVFLATRQTLKLAWFDWIFLVLAVIFALLALQNFTASLAELEPRAAWILLGAFGVPALLFAAIVVVRVVRARLSAPKAAA